MHRPCRLLCSLTLGLLLLQSCGQHPHSPSTAAPACEDASTEAQPFSQESSEAATEAGPFIDPATVRSSELNRAGCYNLRPAPTVVTRQTIPDKGKGKGKKTKIATKKSSAKYTQKKARRTTKVVRTVGLCQPQSLIYARCRTGIDTCRLGNTSPVQWFACAEKNGATSKMPVAGSVIVIDAHPKRRIHTGHPAYVEEARCNGDGTWSLRISHTNYDRKCHLDLDATVIFYPRTMTATFVSGHWSGWAKGLKVLGFILR
nr:hypothetical protein [uncultured Desulfobulbus sp.]